MGDLQDPTDGGTLVPYFWPYFVGIFPYIGLKNRPYIGLIYGRYLHFRFLKWPLMFSSLKRENFHRDTWNMTRSRCDISAMRPRDSSLVALERFPSLRHFQTWHGQRHKAEPPTIWRSNFYPHKKTHIDGKSSAKSRDFHCQDVSLILMSQGCGI